ncbi:DUF742 domain-containing protein [Streptomyces sp. TS71-3]|uniref:DUF742 domain-containing protein n=1 Tax=Streptomyces sp. TS71-3 TaxID=2733862 RepID=UPI001B2965E9|nr:DUF742 domain-containing protein [Streptomyces sp. TS71-3]GHJ35521.1 hypothetical protein Sm713_11300 [Streptomyces sp. TS71-3]
MSTGGGPSGPRRDQDAGDEQTFADVLNSFSLGNSRRRRKGSGSRGTPQDTGRHEQEEASPAPADESFGHSPAGDEQPPAWGPGNAERAGAPASVRAYVWTGGRTRSRYDFEVETLVTAAEPISSTVTQPYSTVLGLCREPRSVAEVAALLAMPLGVAVVLLGDMADEGLIIVHGASTGDDGAPSPALMERVLIGLRQV